MSAMDFEAFVRASGLLPRSAVVPDGRWRRCPTTTHPGKRNGAYCLAPDGLVGWVQDWAVHAEPLTWRPDSTEDAPLLDYGAIRRRREEAESQQREATAQARAFYDRCSALLGGHEYLRAKGLGMEGCRGLKVDSDGWLVVPMGADGQLMSVQRISEDGEKRFWTGAPTSGASYRVDRRGASITVLCEGLATGLAIFAAVPLSRVVVAFNAGNMPRVATQLPRQGMAVVAADNDHRTAERIGENPGIKAAEEAARILGCEVAVPEGIEGSDWCDLRNERMAAALARPSLGWRDSRAQMQRAVDAEIARAMMGSARFLSVAG